MAETGAHSLGLGSFESQEPEQLGVTWNPYFATPLIDGSRNVRQLIKSEEEQNIINARCQEACKLSEYPVFTIKVAGVSFEGRQEHLQNLQLSTLVVFEKEPENVYDPNAVKIVCLDGTQLGYVPKDMTHMFGSVSASFGRVSSVGQNDAGLYGAFICTQPALPYLHILMVPNSMEKYRDLWKYLTPLRRERLRAYAKLKDRCSLTSLLHPAQKLCTVESWSRNDQNRTMILDGIKELCSPLAALERKPLSSWTTPDFALLAGVNGWELNEAKDYVKLCSIRAAELDYDSEQWRVNLDWFLKQGGRIPKKYPSIQSN